MRKIALFAAAAIATIATPALAESNGYVVAGGGVAWAAGNSEAFAAIGAGYDYDLGGAFVGVEGVASKVLATGTNVAGNFGARLGANLAETTKAYATGGLTVVSGNSYAFAGVGIDQRLSGPVFGRVEYRRVFDGTGDVNYAGVGIGYAF